MSSGRGRESVDSIRPTGGSIQNVRTRRGQKTSAR